MPIFSNPWIPDDHGFTDVLKWKFGRGPKEEASTAPDTPAPYLRLLPQPPPESGFRATWLGHSSFLIQGQGLNLLIDPVFSEYCSPFPMAALRRLVPAACSLEDLPRIHAVLRRRQPLPPPHCRARSAVPCARSVSLPASEVAHV